MNHRRPASALLLALAALAPACRDRAAEAPPPAEAQASAAHGEEGGVAWFDGTVEEAFALAAAERKPLFFYWGAVWCPPCHYLKSKLFTRPEFVARMEGFVPVYLDGDTERAQELGETYGTSGYPTVIVFDPDGREVMRIDSTLPVEEYVAVLETAMNATRPVDEVLAAVEAGGAASVPASDLNLLAFTSWAQVPDEERSAADLGRLFLRLHAETPEELAVERARFLAIGLQHLVQARHEGEDEEEDAAPELAAEERERLAAELRSVLADRSLRNVNLALLLYYGSDVVELLAPEPGEERRALVAAMDEAARAVEQDEPLTVDDRLSAAAPRLALARLEAGGGDEAALPPELLDHVRERIAWAQEEVTDEGEKQAVMSTMAGLLEAAGLTDEASDLLGAHLGETIAPYYYTSWLAGIEKERGNTARAVELYREAYESAEGSTTRFRWGTTYLRNALELTPDATETIAADTERIVGELLPEEDAFAGGNWGRLRALDAALAAWQEKGGDPAVVASFRRQVGERCDELADGGEGSPGQRCREVAGTAAAAPAG